MKRKITFLLLYLIAATIGGAPEASADVSGQYLIAFEENYSSAVGTRIDKCLLCHTNFFGGARNPYGRHYEENGHNFKEIELLDSDGDTFINIDEIHNRTFPGEATDIPSILTSIVISPSKASLTVSGTQIFNATARNQNNIPMSGIVISWTSNDTAVGDVAQATATTGLDGIASILFTAAAAGDAMVTAANGTVVGSANITVTSEPPVPVVTSFLLTPDTSVVLKGTAININVRALNGSLDEPLFNGIANITITANNLSAVSAPVDISFVNGNATIQVNSSIAQFVTVTATNGTISGSMMAEFADMVISLKMGYNLISIPSFANPSNITQALQLVQNNGVQTFDPATGMFVTPTDFVPLFAYWINVTDDNQKLGFIADTSNVVVPPTRNLFEGWNMIGVSANRNDRQDMIPDAAFVGLHNGELPSQWPYSRLASFDGANPETFTAGVDLTLDSPPLKLGHGYWLFIKSIPNTNMNYLPWEGKLW